MVPIRLILFLHNHFPGILPIAHMRDYFSPVQLLCNRIPREILQQRYSILLAKQNSTDAPVNAHDLLTAVAFLKGFMSAAGIPVRIEKD